MNLVFIDSETRSKADLTRVGAYNYSTDPTTEALCWGFFVPQAGLMRGWMRGRDTELDPIVADLITRADFVVAHNAEFDMGIWEIMVSDYQWPEIPLEKWYCSSAQARVNGLPASLDNAAWAAGLSNRKMSKGKTLIKLLSVPNDKGDFNEDPVALQEMMGYCIQDVVVMAELVGATRMLTEQEHSDWLATVRQNLRGVRIDRPLAEAAILYAEAEQNELAELLAHATDGKVTRHTQTTRMRNWLLDEVGADSQLASAMKIYENGKFKRYTLDKNVRNNILTSAEHGELALPDRVYDAISLIDLGNKSSVAKFSKMLDLADPEDDRIRGAFIYAGAHTLRFTSKGAQLHNFRRDCWTPEETEALREQMCQEINPLLHPKTGEELDVMDSMSRLLRPVLIPDEGNVFIIGDWSAIEARVLPWLTKSKSAERILQQFRDDADIYTEQAEAMQLKDRQLGKVAVLACGYQGGVNALNAMARNYGIPKLPEHFAARIVDSWRAVNRWAPAFWRRLEDAAMDAYESPETTITAGRVAYTYLPGLLSGSLLAELPGDTYMLYPRLRLDDVETPWGEIRPQLTYAKASFLPKAGDKDWPRANIYGGLLAEQATQSTSGAILRHALRSFTDYPATVHDEIVREVPASLADRELRRTRKVMETPPTWAEGLPLKAKLIISARYGKG